MKLTFYGGAKSVTGANYLLETHSISSGQAKKAWILVDCGLAQRARDELAIDAPLATQGESVRL